MILKAMATKDPEYFKKYRQKERDLDKALGIRYRGWEQIPGESWKDFKRRMTAKTVKP